MALKLFSRKPKLLRSAPQEPRSTWRSGSEYESAAPLLLDSDPLQRLLQLERYGWIVRQRRQMDDHALIQATVETAIAAIDERFAIVPEGFVTLSRSTTEYPGCPDSDVETAPFLLARHCVTNRQFQFFVDSGGYEDLEVWPTDIWAHLIDLKDQTGRRGPRFWREGRHDRRLADHPVVGICFYEAAAYARWAGYRLPTGAEWQMAASWRIRSSANVLRRYPWGDAFDPRLCNLWSSNVGHTVTVPSYEQGAAPNGVLQLIGNVWEWTDGDYEVLDDAGRTVLGNMTMKEIRGGAFDTYFPAQATSCFRTGLPGLSRMHNVGFRCVVDLHGPAGEVEKGEST